MDEHRIKYLLRDPPLGEIKRLLDDAVELIEQQATKIRLLEQENERLKTRSK